MPIKFKSFSLKSLSLGLIAVTIAGATAAMAMDASAVISARHDFFHGLGKAFKGANDELKNPAPDLAVIKGYTAQINRLAPQLPAQFPAGSGPESGAKTGALPEIWSNPAKFKENADALQTAATALDAAAQKGDLEAIKAAMKNTGMTCKSCHTTFRKEDH